MALKPLMTMNVETPVLVPLIKLTKLDHNLMLLEIIQRRKSLKYPRFAKKKNILQISAEAGYTHREIIAAYCAIIGRCFIFKLNKVAKC